MSVKKLKARTSTKCEMKIIAKALSKFSSRLLNFLTHLPWYNFKSKQIIGILASLRRYDYNITEVERKVSIFFFTQVALHKKFFRALFQRNTNNQKEALDKYHI